MKKYLLKNKKSILMFIITVPLACLFSIKFALSFEVIINSTINKNMNDLKESSILALVYAFLDCIFLLIIKYLREEILKNTFINLKNDLFYKIINRDIKSFNKGNIGRYISILDNDVSLIGESYFGSILSIYRVIISFIFSLITIVILNYKITLILIVVAILSMSIPKFLDKRLVFLQNNYSESMKIYTSKIKNFLEGFIVIKTFNIKDKVISSHKDQNKIREELGYKSKTNIYLAGWIAILFSSIMYVTTYIVGGYFSIKGLISVGLVISLTQLIGGVVAPLEQLPAIFAEIKSTLKIRRKLEEILNEEIINKEEYNLLGSFKDISMKNVTFSYEDEEKIALKNINLDFKENKKYAIVGESGSGKSTIAKLILNFYKLKYGEIKFDNLEISNLNSNFIYKNISYIQQDIFLFDDTLRNNITLYKDYSEEEVINVIKLSGLKEVIEKLPKGLDSELRENGSILSLGEKQRISIARALICKSKFIILDEATSSLDNITSSKIMEKLLSLKHVSIIMITHDLNKEVLKNFDSIYVIKDGEIIESGKLNYLIEKKNYFYNLYKTNINIL